MGTDFAEVETVLQNHSDAKVNSSICSELTKLIQKVSLVLPEIESAQPGHTSGIQALCALNNSVDKTRLLFQHCNESSKLYLAITRDATLLRCERIRNSFIQSLSHVQSMVPPSLASKIAEVLSYLRIAKFSIDSAEEEAGRVLLDLLQQTNSSEDHEFEAFQTIAFRLKMTSPKAILLERRSVKKMLDKLSSSDTKKEKILNYFFYLLKKHGTNIRHEFVELKDHGSMKSKNLTSIELSDHSMKKTNELSDLDDASTDTSRAITPPEEYCCPISLRLMHDPVIIGSGQTYERTYIERWFDEGHDTCPKTKKKLENLSVIPNSCMKHLIDNWCEKNAIKPSESYLEFNDTGLSSWEPLHSTSITSLTNVSAALLDRKIRDYYLQSDHSNISFISDASYGSDSSHVKIIEKSKDKPSQLFSWSEDYTRCQSFSNFNCDMYMRFFYNLLELSFDAQDRAEEDMKFVLQNEEETCYVMFSNGFPETLIKFLKNALIMSDIQAQRIGSHLFLAFVSNNRVEISSLTEGAIELLVSLLDSDVALEALMTLQKLAQNASCQTKIVASGVAPLVIRCLDSDDAEFLELSLKILVDLSIHKKIKSLIISSGCITKLSTFLADGRLEDLCLEIIRNVSNIDQGKTSIADASGCITSIVELLETGSDLQQDHAVAIIHSICSGSLENCLLVLEEGVIPALVHISVNGSEEGKEMSKNLLQLLRDVTKIDCNMNSCDDLESSTPEPAESTVDSCRNEQPISKASGFFRKKLKLFAKSRS